ncbi:hypothetical protein HNQ69_001379 [Bartonella callosciuri]|uniref:Uncharacterized protein n=1 Tax=Bartonella callosciuri TaxID=686223 RepID=A0A840NY20_9HYPH|nr:hypothetical protein [Bartonella callosciuri]MBB5074242.1 hypothetical protein [Bartonella callosciuri]
MNHEKNFIGVSIVTTVSFFSSIAEIGNRSMKNAPSSSDSHKSAVESDYKSPFYKLWQYVTKNKPSIYNGSTNYPYNKKYSYRERVFTSYWYSPKGFLESNNYTKKSTSMDLQKQSLLDDDFSLCKQNNSDIEGRNIFSFTPYLYTVNQMLAYIKSGLERNRICARKGYPKRNNLTSRIYENTMWQHSEKPHRIGIYIDKIYPWVYCL